MSGYGDFARNYLAAGWSPLPLPDGQKWPPPDGFTGATAPMVSAADIEDWLAQGFPARDKRPGMDAGQVHRANIALRLPAHIVGLDVDAWKPEGIATMTELTEKLGPLPPTWRSTSRSDGISGIYLYSLPEIPEHMGDVGPGVETIRHGHRYAVVAPSTHPGDDKTPPGAVYTWYAPDGSHKAPRVEDLPPLPMTWVQHLASVSRRRTEVVQSPAQAYLALDAPSRARIDSFLKAAIDGMVSDLRESATWGENDRDKIGRGWEKLQADKAIRLAALALADWNPLTMEQAEEIFCTAAPTGGGWTLRDVRSKWHSQAARATPAPLPADAPRVDLLAAHGGPPVAQTLPATGQAVSAGYTEELDVTNPAKFVDWLRDNLGRGPLSGIFARGQDIVFTPRIGHEGYIEPRVGEPEDSASIAVLDKDSLASRIQNRYRVTKSRYDEKNEQWVRTDALVPTQATLFATKAVDDLRGLRQLRGVVHTPTFRPDGSLIRVPGYDEATGLVFLPTGGQPKAVIPERPTDEEMRTAKAWIDYMLHDFAFVSAEDRANYVGLMLTPLLRSMIPGPYKLGIIEAHQPGSGKTFLARALMSIHSGIMHSELPSEEPELVKTITSILDTSTGAVVVFDNVTGVIRSSALAGLLTSPTFQGRRLGTGKMVDAVNDRLWVLTGNNAALGGDLSRRALRVRIDPGVPNPERRTNFQIADFENWVREHRGELLWSLLTMVSHWVAVGSPIPDEVRTDSYGTWASVVGSVLAASGFEGTFDDPDAAEFGDPDADEWEAFLDTVYSLHGDTGWTVKSLLAQVAPLGMDTVPGMTAPIPFDMLPGSLLTGKNLASPATLSRPLGHFLGNREGRWFGPYTLRRGGTQKRYQVWHVQKHG